jgi:DNA-directed RNA polymerase specialized sigma subunit
VAEREFQGRRFEKRKRLDSLCPTNFDLPLHDVIVTNENILDEKEEKAFFINEIKTKLENLPNNYKEIITEIFFKGKTEHQLAKERKCCRNNINLIKKRALAYLRKTLKAKLVN